MKKYDLVLRKVFEQVAVGLMMNFLLGILLNAIDYVGYGRSFEDMGKLTI